MKKQFFLWVLLLIVAPLESAVHKTTCNSNLEEQVVRSPGLRDKTSQSFMLPRPVFDNLAAKQALWHNIIYNKPGTTKGAWQIITLYQQSIQDEKTRRYFLFDHKTSLTVKGDNIPCTRDVRAEWLGIDNANFNAILSIDPKNRQFGCMVEFQQDLSKISDSDFLKHMWVGLAVPLIVVENNMNLQQMFAQTTTGDDICSAFNQCNWNFGKISSCKQRETGVPELIFTLGTNFLNRDYHQVGMYSSLLVPTHRRQDPEYMFKPVLGNNRHWGFGVGVQFQVRLSEKDADSCLAWFMNVESQFFIRNDQFRTFDLKGKPWSRYLLYNCLDGRRNIPGVNILTLRVQASPYNVVDLSTGFRFKGKHFEGELGYNLWAHGTEELLLKPHEARKEIYSSASYQQKYGIDRFEEIYGIAGSGADATEDCPDICDSTVGATASTSTISEQCADDVDADANPTFVPIKIIDIDLLSGASRSTVTHKFHTSIGYHWRNGAFVGIGAFFEGVHNNAALKQWGVWAKIGTGI